MDVRGSFTGAPHPDCPHWRKLDDEFQRFVLESYSNLTPDLLNTLNFRPKNIVAWFADRPRAAFIMQAGDRNLIKFLGWCAQEWDNKASLDTEFGLKYQRMVVLAQAELFTVDPCSQTEENMTGAMKLYRDRLIHLTVFGTMNVADETQPSPVLN